MKQRSIHIFFLFINTLVIAQITPEEKGFVAHQIIEANDTINFYIKYPKNSIPSDLFIHIEGSYAGPLWIETDPCCVSLDPFNHDLIPENYAYLIFSKQGFKFSGKPNEIPKNYWKKQTLDFRVNRVDAIIKYVKTHIFNPKNLVVIGTSQGSDVVAKLGTINNDITHIGFWGSGGHNQLADFIIKSRKNVYRGKITEEQSKIIIDSLLNLFHEFYKNPSPDKFWDDNSYLSYVSFSKPPLESLLKIDIPIFVAIGTKDENVPIESSYAIPLEFWRKGKDNLTFKHYPHYDHNFISINDDGSETDHIDEVTAEFFEWVKKH
ncbi:alpha/beta hydrolase family protein [Winogradskyella immobilis]|uniref:Dienelactone hydrolase family protein n=1 Tax=Winogradskyella immobilis TaxID=2816852 RepID=A0ABS8EPN3_9FLAO|nr:dienelactone hydrolase family protein [Winogradskyella immobilis]MCC1485183.1 dienelactone hydrolase family protein [Winogradskyella immobilis]MCG0017275.1 alpha/beta hydrolase [Winogradskyella immobilis]